MQLTAGRRRRPGRNPIEMGRRRTAQPRTSQLNPSPWGTARPAGRPLRPPSRARWWFRSSPGPPPRSPPPGRSSGASPGRIRSSPSSLGWWAWWRAEPRRWKRRANEGREGDGGRRWQPTWAASAMEASSSSHPGRRRPSAKGGIFFIARLNSLGGLTQTTRTRQERVVPSFAFSPARVAGIKERTLRVNFFLFFFGYTMIGSCRCSSLNKMVGRVKIYIYCNVKHCWWPFILTIKFVKFFYNLQYLGGYNKS